jgi:DNA-binding MarR family transcriptional regulator
MNPKTRFQLKQSTGWFAAGREIACALQLLSDATFKLFLWLCLHAERSQGTVSATTADLARALGKSPSDVVLALQELQQRGVCTLQAENIIHIEHHFWPYQRQSDSLPGHDLRNYVEKVKRLFLERRCVQSSFTAADEKLARSLYQRGVSLIDVEHAILLGALRKYAVIRQNGQGSPISSLHYFTQLFEEVQQPVSTRYWSYIAHKVRTFEQAEGPDLSAQVADE